MFLGWKNNQDGVVHIFWGFFIPVYFLPHESLRTSSLRFARSLSAALRCSDAATQVCSSISAIGFQRLPVFRAAAKSQERIEFSSENVSPPSPPPSLSVHLSARVLFWGCCFFGSHLKEARSKKPKNKNKTPPLRLTALQLAPAIGI